MSFLSILKKQDSIRKIFGRREIVIIEKQLLGINLTQSEKNRLSRDIRKKFEAIRELATFSREFNLKKGANIKKIIEEAKETILETIPNKKKVSKIVLFGSAAERKLTFRSDIDISVEMETESALDEAHIRKELMGRVPDRVDIQMYHLLPDKIKKDIQSKGRIIYERPD